MDGVDGAVDGLGCADEAGEGRFGMCSLVGICCDDGFGLNGVVLDATLDCLNVIRGPGGPMPCSSRLRFGAAVVSFEGVSVVRILFVRTKCMRPWVGLANFQ